MSTDNSDSPTISSASTITSLKNALVQLQTRHTNLTNALDQTLEAQPPIQHTIAHLDLAHARLASLSTTTRSLHTQKLAPASSTATRLSAAVSRLDTEQRNIEATLRVVDQTATLRACILGIHGCMASAQDWEQAAEYVRRASLIPASVIESGFAANVVPSAECPDRPGVFLEDARESLCGVFKREFERAVDKGDPGGVGRFFKMFPSIGREQVGLDIYGRYVCSGVAERARGRLQQTAKKGGRGEQGGWPYVQALTKLFEHIAQVVDAHSALVQRHYGRGTMVSVMARLHGEADVQGGIVLDSWWDERAVERKLTDVKSYAYTFLVQSFLAAPSKGTPRSQSPALRGAAKKADEQEHEEGLEMREVDAILGEITGMLGHWALYVRFLAARAVESEQDDEDSETQLPSSPGTSHSLTPPPFLTSSTLPRKITKTLTDPFLTFSTYFLRRSVEKSFQLDESPQGLSLNLKKPIDTTSPLITSSVDDVMYMVNQVIQRTLAASQAELARAVLATVGRVLGSDFIGMIQRKLRDENYPKAAVAGAMPPEDKIISFLVLLNNLDIAKQYMHRIVESHTSAPSEQNGHSHANGNSAAATASSKSLTDLFPLSTDAETVRTSLTTLDTGFSTKATDLIHDGIVVAFSQIVKPRVRPFLAELFRESDYSATHGSAADEGSDSENDEEGENGSSSLKNRMQMGWDALVRPVKRLLTPSNAERFISSCVTHLASLLEKRIWSQSGRLSELGAVRLERDVSDIASVAVRGETFRLRDAFARSRSIMSVINLEEEEWDEMEREMAAEDEREDSVSVLSKAERERARAMIRR